MFRPERFGALNQCPGKEPAIASVCTVPSENLHALKLDAFCGPNASLLSNSEKCEMYCVIRSSNQERMVRLATTSSPTDRLTAISEAFAAISTAFTSLFADETTTESGQAGEQVRYVYHSLGDISKNSPCTQASPVFFLTDNYLLRRTLLIIHWSLRSPIVGLLLGVARLGTTISVRVKSADVRYFLIAERRSMRWFRACARRCDT